MENVGRKIAEARQELSDNRRLNVMNKGRESNKKTIMSREKTERETVIRGPGDKRKIRPVTTQERTTV